MPRLVQASICRRCSLLADAITAAGKFLTPLLKKRYERWDTRKRDFERVQSVLVIEDVMGVQTQGVDPKDKDTVLSLLAIGFDAGEDGTGHVVLTLAGDGAVRVAVEALEVVLKDVTRPYVAPSRKKPVHPE